MWVLKSRGWLDICREFKRSTAWNNNPRHYSPWGNKVWQMAFWWECMVRSLLDLIPSFRLKMPKFHQHCRKHLLGLRCIMTNEFIIVINHKHEKPLAAKVKRQDLLQKRCGIQRKTHCTKLNSFKLTFHIHNFRPIFLMNESASMK